MPDDSHAEKRRVVGLIGPDAAVGTEPGDTRRSLSRYATAIFQHTGICTEVIDLAVPGATDVASAMSRRDDLAAVVLLHGGLRVGASHDVNGLSHPVASDRDALAITLTAAVLSTLSRTRRPTARGRVVVAGSDALPNLVPLLVAVNAAEVTMWRPADRHAFPLRTVTAGADVVINLLDDDHELATLAEQDQVPVITPNPLTDALLVLPALVGLLLDAPSVRLDLTHDLGMYCDVGQACAMQLVLATPPDQTYPSAPTRELTERVIAAAHAATAEHREERHLRRDPRRTHP
jgi:hypothetical protein